MVTSLLHMFSYPSKVSMPKQGGLKQFLIDMGITRLITSHFCGIRYATSKQQRDFIPLDATQSLRCYARRMAWISKNGLHGETIPFPGGLRQAKNRKKWREWGTGKENNDSLKKIQGSSHRCLNTWEDAMADVQLPFPANIWHWRFFLSSKRISSRLGERALSQPQLLQLQSATKR